MLHVLGNTILPIFSIIFLGYWLKLKGIIHPDYARVANQIVYYVAIPAMLFMEIAKAPFRANFHAGAVLCVLGALALVSVLAIVLTRLLRIRRHRWGTYLQSCVHGNIGYMSYAIAFYVLGEDHFPSMAILGSFVMLGQNLLAIWALTQFGEHPARGKGIFWRHMAHNPIILAVVAAVIYSSIGLPLPSPCEKSLSILSGMAFPTALLLIGASLSFGAFPAMAKEILSIGSLKLVVLPLLGLTLMRLAHIPDSLYLPAVILLATPPATVTYVMAVEMGGDPELAATSISTLTLLSALSYSLLLSM